jgi:hypothetical protein
MSVVSFAKWRLMKTDWIHRTFPLNFEQRQPSTSDRVICKTKPDYSGRGTWHYRVCTICKTKNLEYNIIQSKSCTLQECCAGVLCLSLEHCKGLLLCDSLAFGICRPCEATVHICEHKNKSKHAWHVGVVWSPIDPIAKTTNKFWLLLIKSLKISHWDFGCDSCLPGIVWQWCEQSGTAR